MAGRFSNFLQPKPERRWLLLLLFLLILVVALAAFFGLRTLGQEEPLPVVNTDAAATRYQDAITREPNLIDGYRNLSLLHQRVGRFDDAIAVWQAAVEANPGQVWPLLGLGRVYDAAGQLLQARDTFYQAVTLAPQDSAANAALAAQAEEIADFQAIKSFLAERLPDDDPDEVERYLTLLRQPLGNGWEFLGFYGDLSIPAAGQPASLWTFWQAPSEDTAPSLVRNTWQQVSPGIWARQALASNVIQNGNFEGELTADGIAGFVEDRFGADPAVRQVRRLARDNGFTTVGVLDNDAENTRSSFVSDPRNVRQDTLLLVAADVQNQGGNPSVTWSWTGGLPGQTWPLQRSAQPGQFDGDWRTYLALVVPPPGVESVQLELLNTDSTDAVYFDNALMTAITAPAPLWPVIAITPAPEPATPAAAAPAAAAPAAAAPAAAAPAAAPAPAPVATLSAQQERAAAFERLMQRYQAYPVLFQDSTWQAELAEIGPVERIGQSLASGWTLLGYSTADEGQLAAGQPTSLMLYWQGPAAAVPGPSEEGWISLGRGLWLQWLPAVTNSLTNGSFENGLNGWPGYVFAAPASTRQLMVTTRGEFSTTVGVLTNTVAFTSTSLVSPAQPVFEDQIFLQTGWLRTDDPSGWIGHQWLGDVDLDDMPPDRYVVAGARANTWRHFAGVAEPLPGARQVQVNLLNNPSTSSAWFDDIVFAPIPAPASAVAIIQQTNARALLNRYIANPAVLQEEEWLAAVATNGPLRLVGRELDNGWTLVGYSADEAALVAGAITSVFYFWRGPLDQIPGSTQADWYSIDAGLWLKIDRTANLLPSNQRLALPESSTAPAVAVDDQLLYLQSGRVQSLNAVPVRVGVTWQVDTSIGPATSTRFVGLPIAGTETEGETVVGLLLPPPGTITAQVLLTSNDATAQAEADSLFLLPVTPPTPAPLPAPAIFIPPAPAVPAPFGPLPRPAAPYGYFAPLAPPALPTETPLASPTPTAPFLPPGLPTPEVPEEEPAVGARPVSRLFHQPEGAA